MYIRKILFDLDGTLFDTQGFHAEAEAELMEPYGSSITAAELTENYAGRPTESVFMEVLKCDSGIAQMLSKKKWEKILPRAKEAKPLLDLKQLFEKLDSYQIGYAIGTASPTDWAWKLINENRLTGFFDALNVIGGDLVLKGKPDPEIWLRAKGRNIDVKSCLVVEDGIAGIEGAVAAGMFSALLLPKTHPKAFQLDKVENVFRFLMG